MLHEWTASTFVRRQGSFLGGFHWSWAGHRLGQHLAADVTPVSTAGGLAAATVVAMVRAAAAGQQCRAQDRKKCSETHRVLRSQRCPLAPSPGCVIQGYR